MNNRKIARHYDTLPDVITPTTAAEYLNIGRSSVYRLLQSGQLQSIRIGSKYIIPKENLKGFLFQASVPCPEESQL